MQKILILSLLLQSSVGVDGTSCAAGRKALADLTGLTCSLKGGDAASCDSNCCEDNKLTCGGVDPKVTCPFDSYIAGGDAWKSKATTKDTSTTDCCTKKAKCGAAPTCPAGWKTKADVTDVMCATDAKSCEGATCCVKNTDTCGGATPPAKVAGTSCDAGMYEGSDDAWKKTVIPTDPAKTADARWKAACCQAVPTCASTGYSCKDGWIRDDDRKDDQCDGDVTKCVDTDTKAGGGKRCCKPNGCASMTAGWKCDEGYYPSTDAWYMSLKTKSATTAKLMATAKPDGGCCAPFATCSSAVCPAGYKMKTGVEKSLCTGGADSCNILTGPSSSPCCEADTATCGGLKGATGFSCAYGFYDESSFFVTDCDKSIPGDCDKKTPKAVIDAWMSKPATEATKNIACCTAKATCSGSAVATTTPAATATPAMPVRRYSERQAAPQKGAYHSMVWLGAGGLIGMSVLMAVQSLRSRIQGASADVEDAPREVDDRLLDNVE